MALIIRRRIALQSEVAMKRFIAGMFAVGMAFTPRLRNRRWSRANDWIYRGRGRQVRASSSDAPDNNPEVIARRPRPRCGVSQS